MPKKTITKKVLIVIFCTAVSFLAASCRHDPVSGGKAPTFDRERSRFAKPVETGRVESGEIKESSGITSSKCQPDVLWTHNDSGDGAFIYAIDGKGRDLGRWKVENAENVDWEDIASAKDESGSCFLYIGDIGNGRKNPRGEHRIYKVEDPRVRQLREQVALLAAGGANRWQAVADAVARVVAEHPHFTRRQLNPNVEFYSAPLLYTLGLPLDLFTAAFALSRTAGWVGHIREQLADNRLIRPKADYVGPAPRGFVPLVARL